MTQLDPNDPLLPSPQQATPPVDMADVAPQAPNVQTASGDGSDIDGLASDMPQATGEHATRATRRATEQAGSELRAGYDEARQAATNVMDDVKHRAADAATSARQQASDLTDTATRELRGIVAGFQEQGGALLIEQTTRAADEIDHIAGAIRKAAHSLHDENDHRLGQYADAAAGTVERVRDYLRDCDLETLRHDVSSFIRRRPEVALGGLFVAGLAAGRFLKASRAASDMRRADEAYEAPGHATHGAEYAYRGDDTLAYATDSGYAADAVGGRTPPPGLTDYAGGSTAGHASGVGTFAASPRIDTTADLLDDTGLPKSSRTDEGVVGYEGHLPTEGEDDPVGRETLASDDAREEGKVH